jgi:hypothetical protein
LDLGKRQILYLFINSLNRYVNLKNIGAFYLDKVKEILEIPDDVNVVALMPLGFPQTLSTKRGRKTLSEIVCYEKYV